MKKSTTSINPGTTKMGGSAIVIYTHLSTAEQKNYLASLKWTKELDGSFARPGNFISKRAQDNADEDFAENINFYLFDPEKLKREVPLAYSWISKKFSTSFKLKEACEDEKK